MMSGDNPEDLTPEEKEAFKNLQRRKSPPQSLEEKTISALRSRNLLNPGRSPWNLSISWALPGLAVTAVAAIVIFWLGFTFGKQDEPKDTMIPPQSLFALLIYNDDTYAGDPIAQGQEYAEWMLEVRAAGRYATGQELALDGRILKAEADQIEARNIAVADSYGALGGFFMIEASSYEEAVRLATGCPHLKYNGTIEIRKVHN